MTNNTQTILGYDMDEMKTLIPLPVNFYYIYEREQRIYIFNLLNIFNKRDEFKVLHDHEKHKFVQEIEKHTYDKAVFNAIKYEQTYDWNNNIFKNIYSVICSEILANLDVNSLVGSSYLMNMILSGNMNIRDLFHMEPKDMCPEKNNIILTLIAERSNVKINVKTTTTYKCGKCYNNHCSIENVQLRALDEGCNTRVTCTFCGNTWID